MISLLSFIIHLCFPALLHQGMSNVTKWCTQERSHICVTYVAEVCGISQHEQ